MHHTFLSRFVILSLAFAALSLAGCGGGGNNGQTSNSPNATIVQPNVIVLPADNSVAVKGQTSSSVTLIGNVPTLKQGVILVSGKGEGFLRRVDSVTKSGGTTVVQTKSAALEDVFQQADIAFNRTLAFSDFSEAVPLQPGVTLGAPSGALVPHAVSAQLTVPLNFKDVQIKYKGQTAAVLNGSGSLTLGISPLIRIRQGVLEEVKFVPTFSGTANVTLSNTAKLDLLSLKFPIAHMVAKPIVVLTGYVPTVFVPIIDVYASLNGSVANGITLKIANAVVTLGAGVQYQRAAGWSLVQNSTLKADFSPTLNAFTSLNFDLTPVRAELNVKIDGVAGPYVSVDCPKVTADFVSKVLPPSVDLKTEGDFVGTAGFKVEIFKLKGDFSASLSKHFDLFQKTYPYDGNVSVGVS